MIFCNRSNAVAVIFLEASTSRSEYMARPFGHPNLFGQFHKFAPKDDDSLEERNDRPGAEIFDEELFGFVVKVRIIENQV